MTPTLRAILTALNAHHRKADAMTDLTEQDEMTGPAGTAVRIPHASYPEARATLDAWIITAPVWHPVWSQYALSLVTLDDIPGLPPAQKENPDVTHQVIVMTLNPEHGPYDARQLTGDSLHYLTPGNIGEQFTATDDQARSLAALCVRAVVDGRLIPETADAPDRIRAMWRQAIHQTLEHDRDPHHGGQDSAPAEADTAGGIVHIAPAPGSGLTPCCGKTPFELPRTDRMASEHADVTCPAPLLPF